MLLCHYITLFYNYQNSVHLTTILTEGNTSLLVINLLAKLAQCHRVLSKLAPKVKVRVLNITDRRGFTGTPDIMEIPIGINVNVA